MSDRQTSDLSDGEKGQEDAGKDLHGGWMVGDKGKGRASSSTPSENVAALRREQNRKAQRGYRRRIQDYISELETKIEVLFSELESQEEQYEEIQRQCKKENDILLSIVDAFASRLGEGSLQKTGQEVGLDSSEIKALMYRTNGTDERQQFTSLQTVHGTSLSMTTQGLYGIDGGVSVEQYLPFPMSHGDVSLSRVPPRSRLSPLRPTYQVSKKSLTNQVDPSVVQPSSLEGQVGRFDPSASALAKDRQIGSVFHTPESSHSTGFSTLPLSDPLIQYVSGGEQGNTLSSSLLGNPDTLEESQSYIVELPQMSQSTDLAVGVDSVPLDEEMHSNLETLEAIKRIKEYALEVMRSSHCYDRIKDQNEMTKVVDGLSHLICCVENYRREASHGASLPRLLRPTELQQSQPHDALIDALPFPCLRQKIISNQESRDLDHVMVSFLHHVQVFPANVFVQSSWQLGRGFYASYPILFYNVQDNWLES